MFSETPARYVLGCASKRQRFSLALMPGAGCADLLELPAGRQGRRGRPRGSRAGGAGAVLCPYGIEPMPPVKLFSTSYVTWLLPRLAPVCRLSYQTHRVDGWKRQRSKKRDLRVTIQALEDSLCVRVASLKKMKRLSKFWPLVSFSVPFAKGVGEARQAWGAVKRNSKRRTIDGCWRGVGSFICLIFLYHFLASLH